jgi:translation initiation factor IF-3
VRVIGADGGQVGIMPTHEALRLAEEQGLELVEVNPRAQPPVCRVMDFGKFKYETSKKEKASRRHQSTVVVKEIKLRPKTDQHDLDFKLKHIRRFLSEGNKCKLAIVFRGREIVHPETGQAMLEQVVKMITDIATVEQKATMEGRRMVMLVGPRSGVIRRPNEGAPAPGPLGGPSAGGPSAGGPPAGGPPAGGPPAGGPSAGGPPAPVPAAPAAPPKVAAPPASPPKASAAPAAPPKVAAAPAAPKVPQKT